ncbi:MFS transporter [Corynebacterium sp. 13CS0277]|nr:MFS transporter [Corynebacterium sp. 13CS0277]
MRAAVTGLSPLLPRITADLGMTTTQVGLVGMIPTAMFAVSALVSPKILKILTIPRALCAGMVLTALGQLLRVLVPTVPGMFAGSLLALFAIGIANALVPLAVRAFFPTRVPAWSMGYLVTMQVGMSMAPLLAEPLAAAGDAATGGHGWRISLGAWSILGVLAATAWLPLLGMPRSAVAAKASAAPSSLPVWRTPVGWGLATMFGFTSFATYAMMLFLPQMYVDGGATPQFAALMLSVWAGLGLSLAFIGPWLVGRFTNPYPAMVAFLIMFVVGNIGIATNPMSAPWVWVVLSSLGPCAFPMGLTLVNIRARTMLGATSLSSFGQGAGYTLACGGPFFVGLLHDHAAGWAWPTAATTAALVVVAIGGFFACRPVYVEDQLAARGITAA